MRIFISQESAEGLGDTAECAGAEGLPSAHINTPMVLGVTPGPNGKEQETPHQVQYTAVTLPLHPVRASPVSGASLGESNSKSEGKALKLCYSIAHLLYIF